MLSHVPRVPFSLDPLIAEAKRRMRRRRLLALFALLIVGGAVVGETLASRWPGGSGSAGPPRGQQVQPHPAANLLGGRVPVDATERQWRTWVLAHGYGLTEGPRINRRTLRRGIESAVIASGARIVRLKLWEANITRPPVELVVASGVSPAVYLRHRLIPLLHVMGQGYHFVKVADRHGSMLFESSRLTTSAGQPEGTVDVPRAFQMCSPVQTSWIDNPPPCPVH